MIKNSLGKIGKPMIPGIAGQLIWLPDLDTSNPVATPSGWAKLSTSATTTITSAQTLYPQLWSRYTSSDASAPIRRNGSDLICQVMNGYQRRTKEIDISSAISTSPSWTSTKWGKAYFYSDFGGVWKINANIRISAGIGGTKVNFLTVTIADIVFLNAYPQPITCGISEDNVADVSNTLALYQTSVLSGNLLISSTATNFNATAIQFDLQLNAEPTTYTTAANMETPKMTPFIKLYDEPVILI